MLTTPGFSQTIPPAILEIIAISFKEALANRHKVATAMTVSPAPETSVISLLCARIYLDSFSSQIKTPCSDKVTNDIE